MAEVGKFVLILKLVLGKSEGEVATVHGMKAWRGERGVEVYLHPFLTLAVYGCEYGS
jgi:hypothetical protein